MNGVMFLRNRKTFSKDLKQDLICCSLKFHQKCSWWKGGCEGAVLKILNYTRTGQKIGDNRSCRVMNTKFEICIKTQWRFC